MLDPERCFELTPADFATVNPNTGTAPIFRTRRDARLTTQIYRRLPVLARHEGDEAIKAWPVKYLRMFDMTNDSHLFRTRAELEEKDGAYPIGGNRYRNAAGEFVPLYEGKMVQAFDHRAASITVNAANQHRPAQPQPSTEAQHQSPDWLPTPQFWIALAQLPTKPFEYALAFKDVTAPTNARSMISAVIPCAGMGNTLPLVIIDEDSKRAATISCQILANFNSLVFDFIARQKI